MKNLFKVIIAMMLFVSPGCALLCGVPPEAQQTAQENAALTDGFILLMDTGATTRDQEQRFIHALRRAWHAQNYALNDIPLPRDIEIWFKKYKLGFDTEESASPLPPPADRVVPDPEWKLPPR